MAKAPVVERPWWFKSKKRWQARQYVNGVLTLCFFYTQEAADKWFADPLAWPDLPCKVQGHFNRRRGAISLRTMTEYEL